MLLTSSQVSIAASSGIVILCTTALFLSGYVLQQRTLRDLREAIRAPAQPKPQMFLPDRFKYMTTELEDGTIVSVETEPTYRVPKQQEVVIEVRPTVEEGLGGGRLDDVVESPTPVVEKEDERDGVKGGKVMGKGKGKAKRETAAQRRRRIKEEIKKMAHDSRPVYYQRRLW